MNHPFNPENTTPNKFKKIIPKNLDIVFSSFLLKVILDKGFKTKKMENIEAVKDRFSTLEKHGQRLKKVNLESIEVAKQRF